MIMIEKIAARGKAKRLLEILRRARKGLKEFAETPLGEVAPAAAITAAGTIAGGALGYHKGRLRERMEKKKTKMKKGGMVYK
jgi:hypothetical protein